MIEIPDKDYIELLGSEQKYRSLIKASPDAVTVTDLEGRIIEVSKKALELHGVNRAEELLGKSAFELIAPEDHARARDQMAKTLSHGCIENIEYVMIRRDGTRFIGELNASVIKDDCARPKAFIATVRDVTLRKEQERILARSEQLYRTMAESCPDFIFLIDAEGVIHYTNSHGARQVGLTPDQLIGKNIDSFFPPSFVERSKWDIQRVIDSNQPFNSEAMVPFSGHQAWFSTRLVPFKTEDGKDLVFGVVRDLTAHKRVEDDLREKMSQINQFNELAVGRELKIIELEKENQRLRLEIERCQKPA